MKPGAESVQSVSSMPALPHSAAGSDTHLTGQWGRLSQVVWFGVALLIVGLTLAGAIPRYNQLQAQGAQNHDLLAQIGLSGTVNTAVYFGWAVLIFVAFCVPAVILYWRSPNDWTALLVSVTLFAVGCASTNFSDALRDMYQARLPLLAIPVDLVRSAAEGLPVITLIEFPGGRAEPRWMRWVAFFVLIWTLVRPFLFFTPLAPRQWSRGFYAFWLFLTLGGAIFAQVSRYLHVSNAAQRQQTKWIVFGGAVAIFGLIALKVVMAFVAALDTPGTATYVVWQLVDYSLYSLCLLPVPLAVTSSILRYRLWDIDFIINRSLVFGGATLLLIGVFGLSLLGVQQIISTLTNGGEFPTIGVIVGAMIVALVFQPALNGLRRFVDRRFYHIEIDYQRALEGGAARENLPQDGRNPETSFGEYTDVQLIGRGGMGEVYRGTHPTLKHSVAIKLLPGMLSSDSYARKRFLREAQTIARLSHPNIVWVHGYGEADGIPYMVMDFVEGISLNDYMAQRGRFSLDEALLDLQDIAAALDYAHGEGIIHRDIKPSNVMLQPITRTQGAKGRLHRAVLMDFGIAKIVAEVTSNLTTSGMIGTIDYIAPEQIQGSADVTGGADIYSMGVMAYEMLTGRLPFHHTNPAAMLIAHLTEPVPDPKPLRPDLPDAACIALLKALAKRPEDRYESAGAFVAALMM